MGKDEEMTVSCEEIVAEITQQFAFGGLLLSQMAAFEVVSLSGPTLYGAFIFQPLWALAIQNIN